MTNEQKRKQITTMFGAYSKRLERLYDQFIDRLTRLAKRAHFDVEDFLKKDGLFRFEKYPELRQEYNEIFKDYVQKEVLAYRAGITDGVALAYAHDALVLSGVSVLSDKAITAARNTAAATFIRNRMKPATGLGLSQLVWNYASQSKSEFDMAISNVIADGLKKGTSAAELSLKVRQYLNNPDMMYRRYHHVIVDKGGNKKDVVKWRRKVIDENGKVRFVEAPLEEVGMGHYRSSRKNADRLMRTEINASYHRANAERWQLEPFVIGIIIDLSPQHPEYDMCDELQGRYPKDFIFTGWHPQCLCMSNPITIQGEEKKEFYKRLAAGEDMSGYVSPNAVKEIPDRAKAWINANREQFISAGERGKLGWVWRDNMKYISKEFSEKELLKMGYDPKQFVKKRIKTAEEKAAIQARWDERVKKNNLIMQTGKNVWGVADQLAYAETAVPKAALREAIIKGDTILINERARALAKQIASINRDAKVYGEYIPNIKEHLKNVSIAELQGVYEGVANKVKFLENKYVGDLLKQSQKYAWEANDYLGANMYGIQDKYPNTWKISQEAYLNLAKKTKTAYDWQEVNKVLTELKQFDSKSKPLQAIIQELDTAIIDGQDLAKAQELAYKGQAKKKQILYDRGYYNKSKGVTYDEGKLYDGGVPYTAEEIKEMQRLESVVLDRLATSKSTLAIRDACDEYADYIINLSKKYYGKQLSCLTAEEVVSNTNALNEYLSLTPKNWTSSNETYAIWNGRLGGVYSSEQDARIRLAKALTNCSEDELSLVTRFTNGMTFSNSYMLRDTSEMWKKKWLYKIEGMSASELKEMERYIDLYEKSINGVINKMQRYDGIVFRGVHSEGGGELISTFKNLWESGVREWVNTAPASSSTDYGIALSFDDRGSNDLIMIIRNKTGGYIRPISEYNHEKEVMLMHGRKYRMLKAPYTRNGKYWVELEEII